MHNWLMLETLPTKEIAVSEAADRLACMDSSYCPVDTRYVTISRRAGLKRPVTVPILPRTIFITASFPDLDAIRAIHGCERIVTNDYGQFEIIPGWQMLAFMAEVEIYRLRAIAQEMKRTEKPARHQRFRSLSDAAQYLKENAA